MTTFINWYCQKVNTTVLTQADFEGQAYEVNKAFYPNGIHLQFQMEECHKMLTDQIYWANPKGDQVRINVSRPLPLGGPPGHVTIQTQFFSNKDLEHLRYGNKGSRPALLISKMKAASYPDFGLKLLVPEQIHDSPSHRREVRKHMRILSVVRIKACSRYGYDYLSGIVLQRANFQEYKIVEKYFKNLYTSNFEDLNLLLLQGHLDYLPSSDKHILSTAVKLWTRNLFSDGTLTRILEALDYRVKEFKIKRLNPVDIEKVAVRSSLRSLKPKCTIESRAKRSSINLIRTLFHITCSSHNVKTRVIIRVLRIILVVLPEHPSDTYMFTMKMEILLEPTSNKLMVGKLGDSDVHTLEDPTLILEILSRRFFLRLNLPDHRSILTGSGGSTKDRDGDTSFQWASATLISKSSRSDQVLKLTELQERRIIKAFIIKKGMSMPVQMSQAQDGKRPQVDD
ncbi:hypothetical protein Tco_0940241 [Tanacetum coccineum]|uniref:Uncharacterized protein n=1 Tax=Tanacetum coccineum TaxID=301880 RepID=A0ABQ5DMF6_9ASTR